MKKNEQVLTVELRQLIRDLGKNGGMMGPSIYDTAQVLRFAPPRNGVKRPLAWLLAQQQPDGGWGDPLIPLARYISTLASLLTARKYSEYYGCNEAIEAGLQYLEKNPPRLSDPLPDDLPTGVELLIMRLLDECKEVGLEVNMEPYQPLLKFGEERLNRLKQIKDISLLLRHRAIHSFEGWGESALPEVVHPTDGVGSSPAATAFWLNKAADQAHLQPQREQAEAYLRNASKATGVDIVGVVPNAWPIYNFERAFGLYAVLLAGMIHDEMLADVIDMQAAELARTYGSKGVGFTDSFVCDGDNTAVTISIIRAVNKPIDASVLDQYAHAGHYSGYIGELQPSLSVTAHAVHALSYGHNIPHNSPVFDYILERQQPDGTWSADKWNGSWMYVTTRILNALIETPHQDVLQQGVQGLIAKQNNDSGWGSRGVSNAEETAYVVLLLQALDDQSLLLEKHKASLYSGYGWLLANYEPYKKVETNNWLAKEAYCPQRIARIMELTAVYKSIKVLHPMTQRDKVFAF